MPDEDLPAKLKELQTRNLPTSIDKTALTPFSLKPSRIESWYELDELLIKIFDEEAKRLVLTPERYEYSCLNELYKTEHPILDTHYIIYDPGSGILRGIVGNYLGKKVKKEQGIDLGGLFEDTSFSFDQVLFRFPGVDVAGYGIFHTFFNVLNRHLKNSNLAIAYVRQEDDLSFRHGFHDHIGLIEGVPGKGLGKVTAGEVEMYPVEEIEEKLLYAVNVKGGRLWIAPTASCNWDLNSIEGMTQQDFLEAKPDDVPVKDRFVDTFHFLNGVTPHYMRGRLTDALSTIREYIKPNKKSKPPLSS